MAVSHQQSEAILRGARMLRTALGPAIAGFLEDPAIVEVMLNPDGRLWIDRLVRRARRHRRAAVAPPTASASCASSRIMSAPRSMPAAARLGRAAGNAASGSRGCCRRSWRRRRSRSASPPSPSSRSTTTSPPGSCPADRPSCSRRAVADRRNILVAGGTSTGKTTLANALLAEVAKTADRVVLIEDTRELQCAAPNLVALRTKDGVASLSDLVRSSLRLRPDRIPIGEVRGAEALDLLKAWGTGHPGGIGTIHAGSAHRRAAPARAAHPGSRRHRPARADRRDHRPHRGARRPRRRRAGSPSSPASTGLGPTGDYRVIPALTRSGDPA